MRHRILLNVVVGTVLICGPSVSHAKAATVDKNQPMVEAAIALVVAGKVTDALIAIEAPLTAYESEYKSEKRDIYCASDTVTTLLYMGIASSAKRSAVAITPGWCEALFIKGYALIDAGRVRDGLPYLQRAVAMAPYNPHYLNELGYAHQALKDWPKSLDIYQRAETAAEFASPDRKLAERTRALRGMGYVLVERGEWDEAAAMYRKCLELDPNDVKSTGELRYIAENRPKKT